MGELKRAFCYTRVSTDQQNTKAQEAELKDYVQRRGWVLKNIYTEQDFRDEGCAARPEWVDGGLPERNRGS
jgi:DNA invertase Pin-like site-specific DNA recombinase